MVSGGEPAELVTEGLTNQAITSRLSVVPRTAEAHVENIRRSRRCIRVPRSRPG